ncbi:MAG: type IV toxin-antitoxin system AbiEi family antitoxin domain-containing protein [Bacteroidota bacterium]
MIYLDFKEALQAFPVFSVREIEKHFPGFDNRRLVEWQEKGYIQKLRNRYYRFMDHDVDEAYLFYCANAIYAPSYVSLESALSIHGFIPEGVLQITSCTTLKTNRFETPIGVLSYRNVKPALFFGYELRQWDGHRYAVAGPEKTIIDYLYLHTEIEGPADFESLRWNKGAISNRLSMEKLDAYLNHIDSHALHARIHHFKSFLNADT